MKDLRYRARFIKNSYARFTSHFSATIRLLSNTLSIITFIAALLCLVTLTVFSGYDHNAGTISRLMKMIHAAQITFIVNVLFNMVFNFRVTIRETRIIKWIVDVTILLTLLPLVYPHPQHPWFPWLEQFLYSNRFLLPAVGAYSIVALSYGVMKVMGRRTNPSLMLAVSFLFFILVGSLMLMMPRCSYNGIDYIDSLFVSTSAVCITGLTPIDISAELTPFGLLILALLIQIGGLGVMTFTSFFALFFSGNTSIYSQLMVKDMIYSKTINALVPTILYILGFTLVIELAGAAAFFLSIHGTLGMTIEEELIFSAFHSLSAFCNAGFSNIEGGLSNPALLHSNQSVYIVASLLILAGGIGFPILVNLKSAFLNYIKRLWRALTRQKYRHGARHIYDMNTKIVLVTTMSIMIVSSALFFFLESDNSLAGMSLYDRVVQSVFNSFVPRSSGFSSVSPAGFLNLTIIMMIFLMWIGGASQSTAGGIKVNTFAAIILNLKAVITGRRQVTVFKRTISSDSMRRANAVVTLSIISYLFYAMTLIALEPGLPVKSLLYEAASALFTVGSSLGVTDELGNSAKVLLCTAMFLGRVGVISLLIGIAGRSKESYVKLPTDNIIIN